MTTVDEKGLQEFVGGVVGDWGAVLSAPLVVLGDHLGLYRAMADGAPVTSQELAQRTSTVERYVREWLGAQAASGYITADGDGRFHLSPEQAVALTDEASPFCVLGGFEAFTAAVQILPRLQEAFRTGEGIGWEEHAPGLFRGTARFFRPGYAAHLIAEWLPALDGVVDRLSAGGRVADVGCGYGHSTLLMAQAFPRIRVDGYDAHPASIEVARKLAADAGVADRVDFQVATAQDFPATGYDLITFFDCLHDMGDPVGALSHTREALAPGGTVMLVEPAAGARLEENLHPLGRVFYSISTLVCTPVSLSQDVGAALGAQAGEDRLRDVAAAAGLTRFRHAAGTPFNMVLQAQA